MKNTSAIAGMIWKSGGMSVKINLRYSFKDKNSKP